MKQHSSKLYHAPGCLLFWKNIFQVTNCNNQVNHCLIHQALTRTMRSGWLILVPQEETRWAMAASWGWKKLTGGGRNNLCAEMAVVMQWARSRAPACAPEKITYGRTICLLCEATLHFYHFQRAYSLVKPWPTPFQQWLWLPSSWKHIRVCETTECCKQNSGALFEWRGGWTSHSWVKQITSLFTCTCTY